MADAVLKPSNFRQTDEFCRLISRKGGGLVLVQLVDHQDKAKGNPFSVDRSRLRHPTDRAAPIADDIIDALPWQGRGADPATGGVSASRSEARPRTLPLAAAAGHGNDDLVDWDMEGS